MLKSQVFLVVCFFVSLPVFGQVAKELSPKPDTLMKVRYTYFRKGVLESQIMKFGLRAALQTRSGDSMQTLSVKLRKAVKSNEHAGQADLEYQLGRLVQEKHARQDYDLGVRSLKSAARYFGEQKKHGRQAECLMFLGLLYLDGSQSDLAVPLFKKVLTQYELLKDKSGCAWAHSCAGRACFDVKKYDVALLHFGSALKFAKQLGHRKGMANSFHHLGIVYCVRSEFDTALKKISHGLRIFSDVGDRPGMARLLNSIGIAQYLHNDFDKALETLERSLKIEEQLGDLQGTVLTLKNLGLVQKERGKYYKSLSCLLRSQQLMEQIGDRIGAKQVLNNIGVAYHLTGENDLALTCVNSCLKSSTELGDRLDMANSHSLFGVIELERENYGQAREHFLFALDIYKEVRELDRAIDALVKVGVTYGLHDDNGRALYYYLMALKVQDSNGRLRAAARTLCRIGVSYDRLGFNDKAHGAFERSLKIYKTLGAQGGLAETNLFFGLLLKKLGKYDEALKHFAYSVNVYRSIGAMSMWARAVFALAESQERIGDDRAALASLEQVVRDTPSNVFGLKKLAWFLATTNVVALRDSKRALKIARNAAGMTREKNVGILAVLAEAYHANNRFAEALETAEKAEVLTPGMYTASLERFNKAVSLGQQVERSSVRDDKAKSSHKKTDQKNPFELKMGASDEGNPFKK